MDEIKKPRFPETVPEELVRYLELLADTLNANFDETDARIAEIKEKKNGKENER